jgi:hypothetical protein
VTTTYPLTEGTETSASTIRVTIHGDI